MNIYTKAISTIQFNLDFETQDKYFALKTFHSLLLKKLLSGASVLFEFSAKAYLHRNGLIYTSQGGKMVWGRKALRFQLSSKALVMKESRKQSL